MKLQALFNVVLATALAVGPGSWAQKDCMQEQLRLRAQVRALEQQVKRQHVAMEQLRREKEIQLLEVPGEGMELGGLGDLRTYADCSEIYNDGHTSSGLYQIQPLQSPEQLSVHCDMSDGGGWTVVQRRSDGSVNFNRGWDDYEKGFGNFDLKNGEFWIGNKNLHLLTSQGNYTLRIDLADFEGESRFAQYESFKVGDEKSSYMLTCGRYSGTAGDSLGVGSNPETEWWGSHRKMKFSTWDRDNDNYEGNCAAEDKAGWWFNRCHSANLNGIYYHGPYTALTDNGVVWHSWHGWWYSLKSVRMKIRPGDFVPNVV
ncbi:fibrinogen-like protein 1 [Tachyglossus aculeatus]|uniref:fibrinogen-like protein 1 n=1 Tax=Tachyglossus aculeatus TaxID=9261 RepID=UPI0018F7B20A|nr:fibrinogen-like protein 1 [Tachyglossus aculeatus]